MIRSVSGDDPTPADALPPHEAGRRLFDRRVAMDKAEPGLAERTADVVSAYVANNALHAS